MDVEQFLMTDLQSTWGETTSGSEHIACTWAFVENVTATSLSTNRREESIRYLIMQSSYCKLQALEPQHSPKSANSTSRSIGVRV